jgi:ABC-type lipoprotein release transport system permease subunit
MLLFIKLAWRNIWRHRRRTVILVLSITLSLGMMLWYDGTIDGFQDAIYSNAIKVLGGNVQVHLQGYDTLAGQDSMLPLQNDQEIVKLAKQIPEVIQVSRRIKTGGMATNREGAFSVSIIGIEPELEAPINLMAQNVVDGRYLAAIDEDQVFIGKGLAEAMELKAGDTFTLTGKSLHNQMRKRTMTVAGIYDLGMRDIEKQTVYISLTEAQGLYGLTNSSNEVVISLKNLGGEFKVMDTIRSGISGIELDSWQTSMPEMERAINSKGGVMGIFSMILFIIAGIGILNLLLMAIYERTREIGVLAALGMHPRQITWLFVLEGAMMALVGVISGVVFGLAINLFFKKVGFDYSSFSSATAYTALISGKVYPSLGLDKLGSHIISILVVSLLASIYPASQAARKDPAEALHFV